ncbi:MAG TPA: hypothetical protein VH560_03860 [Polyangia bacterium]|jgi:hypothetical protein|nr:hypothetical protein [Polyangia bacterium]
MNRRVWVALVAVLVGCGTSKPSSLVDGSSDQSTDDADASKKTDARDAAEVSEAGKVDAPAAASADASGVSDAGATDALADGRTDASEVSALGITTLPVPASCAGAAVPPLSLLCTGLYADITTKTIAPGIAAYTPAVSLWADGATKQRWIFLPAGMKIDNSNPNEWIFPIGTKVWKEFSRDGIRVETRLWQKVTATYWVDTAYQWNGDESAATATDGGDIPWGDGGTYHIPTPDECQQCHRGRTDRILGFEQSLLGMAGAEGLTLGVLANQGRLTTPLAVQPPLVVGDDGTGLAAPALAWLHVNCGTTCHNRNEGAAAFATGLFMRLDPTQLDGRSVKGFDTLTTTIGVAAVSPSFKGKTRIVPKDPTRSLLYQLISHRGTGVQMPPIATNVVDEADIPLVQAWIDVGPPLAPPPDGGTDAMSSETGASHGDAGTAKETGGGTRTDASSTETSQTDVGVDAGVDVAAD